MQEGSISSPESGQRRPCFEHRAFQVLDIRGRDDASPNGGSRPANERGDNPYTSESDESSLATRSEFRAGMVPYRLMRVSRPAAARRT